MEFIFIALVSLAWEVIKGLFLILVTYYIYEFLTNCIETVWEMLHPKSLNWTKSKLKRGKK
jgi:hypothetical protein